MKITLTVLLATFALPFAVLADEKPRLEKKTDSLLVYGEGFLFSVKEPPGWVGDTENAGKYGANVIFYPAAQKGKKGGIMIRVLIADKVDENTADDLAHDMTGYKRNFPKIKFEEITVTHPSYRVFPKIFTVPGRFYEYVAYLNPGPKRKLMFSASMSRALVLVEPTSMPR